MNKQEFKAISMIARKMNWQNKPVIEVCEIINQMVRNQQALELDCIGECDDYEETLLSIATWDASKVDSTLHLNDYHSLVDYEYTMFLETMEITESDYQAMLDYYDNIAPKDIEDDECDYDYMVECMEEAMWITKHC